jgi:hypothetical protein
VVLPEEEAEASCRRYTVIRAICVALVSKENQYTELLLRSEGVLADQDELMHVATAKLVVHANLLGTSPDGVNKICAGQGGGKSDRRRVEL